MNLELLIGPYRSGKTSIAVQEALSFCRENPLLNSVVITPSARYRALIEDNVRQNAGNSAGIMGLRFETFYQFVRNYSTAAPAPIISNRLRNRLLAGVLQSLSHKRRLPHLGAIAEMRGTAAAVGALIDEFQRAAFSPEQVIAALNFLGEVDSRHMEFAEIYRCYRQELQNCGCLDEKFQAMQLCELPGQNGDPGYGVIIFDGFDRYSRLQARLAKRLAASAHKVLLLFDYVPDADQYIWKKSSYEMLRQELQIEPRIVPPRTHKQPVFDSFTSLDRFTEMQEIARQIKLLITIGELAPQDVLVTARHIRSYRGAVTAAFENLGIPCFLDRSYPVGAFPVMHFVLALLGLQVNDFLRQDVIAILKSRYFRQHESGFSSADVESIDNESLEAFVLKGRLDWERCLQAGKQQNALSNLFEQLTPQAQLQSLCDHCRWCEDRLDQFADFSSANISDYGTGSCLAALRNSFASLIEEERVLGSKPVEYAEFYEKLKEILEGSNFRSATPGGDYVTICDAELVPNRTYKVVFVAGMLEGEFPAKDRQPSFAGAENLEAWRRRGVPVDNPRTHPGYEDALLKTITQSGSLKVFMSCPRYDSKVNDKEELLPSFALRQFFANVEPDYVPVFEKAISSPGSAKDAASAVLWQQPDANLSALEHMLPEQSTYLRNLQACITPSKTRLAATRQSCFNGYLVDLIESGALPVNLPPSLSATSLNRYAECPFKFWSADVLKLSPRQEVDPGEQHKLIGNFYHHIMEEFYKQVIKQGIAVDESNGAQLKILFDAAVAEGLTWLEDNPEFHSDEFWPYRKNFLKLVLDKFFKQELSSFSAYALGFYPYRCEAVFGLGGKFPALELPGSGGRKISIRGKIDRIDMNQDMTYGRVVDYKSSTYGLSIKAVVAGQDLQLPLYCLALTKAIVPGCKVNQAQYAVVGTAESRAVNGSPAVDESMRAALHSVQQYDAEIHRGNFLVQPRHESCCRRCDQRKICRIAELPTQVNNHAD